jgi:hypothetical protein
MFTSTRYMTQGIQNEVGLDLQLCLWSLIDARLLTNEPMDYLQIFVLKIEFDNGHAIQKVIHKQEEPEYESIHLFNNIATTLNMTIWVIDDGSVTTMLLPSEY